MDDEEVGLVGSNAVHRERGWVVDVSVGVGEGAFEGELFHF